jgi:assimilatory nitrate reductase catalytic subunit
MNLVRVEDADTLTVAPRPDFPTNKGGMCHKGWTSAELLTHPDRLTTPLIRDRRDGELRPATWDEALDRIAAGVAAVQERWGRDAVGMFGGGGLTNEKSYLLGKFARVALRTCHIDYNGRFCMSSAAAAAARAFGIDRGLPFPLEDIPRAQTILMVGANPAETMPPMMQYFDAQRSNGGALIVADPRLTATAQSAALHLPLTPGTDGALLNGLLNIAIRERRIDEAYIAARTTGWDAVRNAVSAYWPDRVERLTGVPIDRLHRAVQLLSDAPTAMLLTARGPEQQSSGVHNSLAGINLMLALGKVGKPNCGWGTITGQGNGQGGREHGQKADQLPGYRLIANPEHRAHIAGVWGIDADELPGPGKSAYEMLDALGTDGGVRALFVMASNIVVSAPRALHVAERLDALDLLVVSDLFLSETAQMADVVLPSAQWAEEDGTMTNLEGRVIRRRRAQAPPEGVRTDAEFLVALSARLGCGAYFPTAEPREIFAELRRATAGGLADYSGITYERIEAENGVFWPCPTPDHNGTPRLFLDRFATPDGRARFHSVRHLPAQEEPDDDFPFYLTTGRVMQQYQSGTQTRRVKDLSMAMPEPFVELHPTAAGHLGIVEGDMVRIATRRGAAEGRARVTATIRPDTLFMPFHWGGKGSVNRLTNPALDPISRMPEFKVCAARVAPVTRSDFSSLPADAGSRGEGSLAERNPIR